MKYVVSDIHGNLENWKSILGKINLNGGDELYVLGDVIDRHPHGIDILLQIMSMKNVHMILGNHEYMMLEALGFPYDESTIVGVKQTRETLGVWYINGGEVTHEAYKKLSEEEQLRVIEFLRDLPINMNVEVGKTVYRLCHATVEEMYDLVELCHPETRTSFCVWDRETVMMLAVLMDEDTKIIFGHTPTINFQPDKETLEIFKYGNVIGIDCGSGFPEHSKHFKCRGRLACLCLDTEEVIYSK